MFIPCKQARRHMMADAIIEAGYPREFAHLASELVPDVLAFHAVFVNPEPIRLEIIDRQCFLLFCAELLYLGRVNDDFTVSAAQPWRELSIRALPDAELPQVNVDVLLAQSDPTRWALEHQHYLQADTRISIDIAKHLRPFVEVSADE